jgi:hypothetical protein
MKIKLPVLFDTATDFKWGTVDAEIICIGLDAPLSFAVHKMVVREIVWHGFGWRVTNIETGCCVARAKTKQGAIEGAKQLVLRKGPRGFMNAAVQRLNYAN